MESPLGIGKESLLVAKTCFRRKRKKKTFSLVHFHFGKGKQRLMGEKVDKRLKSVFFGKTESEMSMECRLIVHFYSIRKRSIACYVYLTLLILSNYLILPNIISMC
jgi:hypothetical protein